MRALERWHRGNLVASSNLALSAINPSKYAPSGAFLLLCGYFLKAAFWQYAKLNTIQKLHAMSHVLATRLFLDLMLCVIGVGCQVFRC